MKGSTFSPPRSMEELNSLEKGRAKNIAPMSYGGNVQKFSELMRGNELIVAPVALNPIMARLAEEAGFKALYLSGGSLGWLKCVTEANLTLPELAAVALDMRAICRLPIVLDAGGGWGDPVHVHHTIALAEA